MFFKKIKIISILFLLYQTPLYSKSTSFNDFKSNDLSKYFSGIVAFGNKDNSIALEFFNSSKILLKKHDPYLKRYIYSLVLENKVSQAINIVRNNKEKSNSNFIDAYLLLILDSLKKNDFDKAGVYLKKMNKLSQTNRFNSAISESLKQYIHVFKEKKILDSKKNLGKLSIISETFQRCYLGDIDTDTYFLNLINDEEADYTRYIYFYLTYLIENNRVKDAKKITNDLDYINTTLLLSQVKSWFESGNEDIIKDLIAKLYEWTDQRWIINVSMKKGDDTIIEKQKQKQDDIITELSNSDEMKKVLEAFPDSEITSVNKIEN